MSKNKIFRPIEPQNDESEQVFRKTKNKFTNKSQQKQSLSVLTAKPVRFSQGNIKALPPQSVLNEQISDQTVQQRKQSEPPTALIIKRRPNEQIKESGDHKLQEQKSLNIKFFSKQQSSQHPILKLFQTQNDQLQKKLSSHKQLMQATIKELKQHKSQKLISIHNHVQNYKLKMNILQKQKQKILQEHSLSLESIL